MILGLGCNAAQAQKSAVTCIWHYHPDHVTYLPHSNYGKVVYQILLPKTGNTKNYRGIRYHDVPWRNDEFVPLLPFVNDGCLLLPEGYSIGEGEISVEEKEVLIREFKKNEFVMPCFFHWPPPVTGTPSESGFEMAIEDFYHTAKDVECYPRTKYVQYPSLRIIKKNAGRYSWLHRTFIYPFRYHADEGKLYMLNTVKAVAPIIKRTDMPQYKYIYKDSVEYFNTLATARGQIEYDLCEIFYPGNFYDYVTNYGQPKPELEKPECYVLFGRGERNYLMACCLLPMEKGEGELVVTTVGGRELERYPLTTMLNYIEIATKSVPEVVLTLYVNGEKIKSFTSPTSKI